eukprot:5367489-Prymnesium_polylepis.2
MITIGTHDLLQHPPNDECVQQHVGCVCVDHVRRTSDVELARHIERTASVYVRFTRALVRRQELVHRARFHRLQTGPVDNRLNLAF